MSKDASAIRELYRFMVLDRIITGNPAKSLQSPRFAKTLPRSLSLEDIETILASCGENRLGLRDRAIIEALYSCGLRATELVTLRTADVFLDHGILRVMGKGSKERFVPIGDRAVAAIHDYLLHTRPHLERGQSPYLFLSTHGNALQRRTLWADISRRCARAGIPDVHPHMFRHSFATHLLRGGADIRFIQDMMGHANLTTTEIYIHADPERLGKIHTLFHPRSQPSAPREAQSATTDPLPPVPPGGAALGTFGGRNPA